MGYVTLSIVELKALMFDTRRAMCEEDAKDATAYMYAYDRLIRAIEAKENGNE